MPFDIVLPQVTGATPPTSQPLNADPAIVSAIRKASAQSGTRFDVMLASAKLESGLDPNAAASGSSAKGLFQFVDQTWLSAVRQFGASHGLASEAASVVRRGSELTVDDPKLRQRILALRDDPTVASELAGDHLRSIADNLTTTLGRAPDASEIYLGHFLGTAGAGQMIQASQSTPSRTAADLLPQAAAANPGMFRSRSGAPYTVAQFMAHLRNRVAAVYAELGTAMPQSQMGVDALQSPPNTNATVAVAGGTGASSAALHVRRPMEQQMMGTLIELLTRLDRDNSNATQRRGPQALPEAVLSALQSVPGSTGVPAS